VYPGLEIPDDRVGEEAARRRRRVEFPADAEALEEHPRRVCRLVADPQDDGDVQIVEELRDRVEFNTREDTPGRG
jgi:hypothetical protein